MTPWPHDSRFRDSDMGWKGFGPSALQIDTARHDDAVISPLTSESLPVSDWQCLNAQYRVPAPLRPGFSVNPL
jgi:hypothetical protein